MSDSIWVFDSFLDTIQEWTLDDLIYHLGVAIAQILRPAGAASKHGGAS